MSDLSPVSGSEMPTLMSAPGVAALFDEVPRPHEVATRARIARASGALVTLSILIGLLLQKGKRPGLTSAFMHPPRPSPAVRTNVCANVTMACPRVKRGVEALVASCQKVM